MIKTYHIKSFTDGQTTYVVRFDVSNRAWHCSCPIGVLQSKQRVCKHIQITSLVLEMLRAYKTDPRLLIDDGVVELYVQNLIATDAFKKEPKANSKRKKDSGMGEGVEGDQA